MAARAIWKGKLKLDSKEIPVKLYAAVEDKAVRFNILDERSLMRVKQRMVDPETDKEVAPDEIQKGFELESGTFVILNDEELEELEPKASREIEISAFVRPEELTPQWYERPYYLGPDGNQEDYFALAKALEKKNREGIAHWVMRKIPYVGALRARDGYLLLYTLRNADEVLLAENLPKPSGRGPTQKELSMAKQLVGMLEGEFDPAHFKDDYRQRVLEFIEQKAKGKRPKLSAVRRKRKTAELDNVLAKSIERLKKEKRAA